MRARLSSDAKKTGGISREDDHVRCVVSGDAVPIPTMSKDPRVLNVKIRNVVTLPLSLFGSSSYHQTDCQLYINRPPWRLKFITSLSYSYLFMTIISSETRATQRRASSATGIVKLKVNSTRTVLPIAPLGIVPSKPESTTLVRDFILSFKELENYKSVYIQLTIYLMYAYFDLTRNGKPVLVDGQTLSIAAVTAASRYHASVFLDESPVLKAKISQSRKVMADKVDAGLSVYGVSTGFGGSADTRTDEPILLGNALLQHQQSGVLPSSMKALDVLPLQDPLSSTSMPESWVRGAILIRMNSLIRGHSGIRWELIEKMGQLLRANITPLVPLYGTISASGGTSFTLILYPCSQWISRSLSIILYCGNPHWQPFYSRIRRSRGFWRAQSSFFM